VFLLGLLTKRVQENSAIIAMVAGLIVMIYVKQWTHIAFTWYVLIGTTATFLTGLIASIVIKESSNDRQTA
jgi:SSS family solute:Na+ symporter